MKSFATSICPIKNPLAVNMMHPRTIPAPSPRGKTVIYQPFGTATLPRGTSEASSCGGPSPNRSQNVFFPVS